MIDSVFNVFNYKFTQSVCGDEQDDEKIPPEFLCVISQEVMNDPVVLVVCGHTFDRASIDAWFRAHNSCPSCRTAGSKNVKPNFTLKTLIDQYLARRPEVRAKEKLQADHDLAVRVFADEAARADEDAALKRASQGGSSVSGGVDGEDAGEIVAFLAALKLDQYAPVFARHGVDDVETLRALTKADYEQMGVLLGHRTKITSRLGAAPSDIVPAEDGDDGDGVDASVMPSAVRV